jgi:hypothetical protein
MTIESMTTAITARRSRPMAGESARESLPVLRLLLPRAPDIVPSATTLIYGVLNPGGSFQALRTAVNIR